MSRLLSALLIGLAFGLGISEFCTYASPSATTQTATVTARAVGVANAFLATLDAAQRSRASYSYTDQLKSKWHNLPPQMANRAGIRFGDLSDAQRQAAEAVLRAVLSTYGEQKVRDIMAADQYLGEEMGAGFPTGPGAYMLAIFGTPSLTEPWEVQFNGHHLGVNVTIVGAAHVLAPTLTAAYPNMYSKDGKDIIVLRDEAERALKLMRTLDTAQRARAIQALQMWNFVLGPGHDGQMVQPEGLRASDMTSAQRQLLVDATSPWVSIVDDATAAEKMAEVRRNLDNTYFLWSGDTSTIGNAYFRIQGPTIWIEYAPQTLGGPGSARGRAGTVRADQGGDRKLDPTHVHTVYRDFTNDYAKSLAPAF
jgi:hypothetical protein